MKYMYIKMRNIERQSVLKVLFQYILIDLFYLLLQKNYNSLSSKKS